MTKDKQREFREIFDWIEKDREITKSEKELKYTVRNNFLIVTYPSCKPLIFDKAFNEIKLRPTVNKEKGVLNMSDQIFTYAMSSDKEIGYDKETIQISFDKTLQEICIKQSYLAIKIPKPMFDRFVSLCYHMQSDLHTFNFNKALQQESIQKPKLGTLPDEPFPDDEIPF